MAATPDNRPADVMGDKMKALVEGAPDTMAELMRAFIQTKDLNARVKIRLRMKALLDIVAVDTVYPKVPARDMDHGGGFMGGGRPRLAVGHGYAEPAPMQAEMDRRVDGGMGGGVLPVPGADPVPQNDDVLG
jgi:hypothetical protein